MEGGGVLLDGFVLDGAGGGVSGGEMLAEADPNAAGGSSMGESVTAAPMDTFGNGLPL